MNEVWEPWKEYKKELVVLPIKEPPCKGCIFFKPVRVYKTNKFEGVIICQAESMYRDFSCYKEKP